MNPLFEKELKRSLRIPGTPIDLHWSLLLPLGMFAIKFFKISQPDILNEVIGVLLIEAVLLIASATIHELGHAYMAERCGGKCVFININILGGLARVCYKQTPSSTLKITAGGPLASLLLAVLFLLVARFGYAEGSLTLGAIINILAGVGNLLPIRPFDGGELLAAAAELYRAKKSEQSASA